jgi:hypothetical protein
LPPWATPTSTHPRLLGSGDGETEVAGGTAPPFSRSDLPVVVALRGLRAADEGERPPCCSTFAASAGKSGQDAATTKWGEVGRRFNWEGVQAAAHHGERPGWVTRRHACELGGGKTCVRAKVTRCAAKLQETIWVVGAWEKSPIYQGAGWSCCQARRGED